MAPINYTGGWACGASSFRPESRSYSRGIDTSSNETDNFILRPALQESTRIPLVDNSEEVEVSTGGPAGQERTAYL